MGEKAKTVRVAAVQMESKNGLIEANLEHATRFVDKAAQKGAKLIILPEFMPTGYIFTTAIWDAAETKEGPTVSWLKESSKKLGVSLGTSFLEAEGEDFFNTFVMTTPNGEEAGRVRKQTPAFAEAYFTKGDAGSHVINTELGKIRSGHLLRESTGLHTADNVSAVSRSSSYAPLGSVTDAKFLIPSQTSRILQEAFEKLGSTLCASSRNSSDHD